MSYTYRDRERDWDESRPVSIKRYVIPPDDDRRDFMSRHEDPYAGERELVIRRKTDRDEPVTISRYEREIDYEAPGRYERQHFDREYLNPYINRRYSRSMEGLELVAPHVATDQTILIREARNTYSSPRDSEYDVVRRSEVDEDPYYYHRHRRVREYDDHRSRRELSPDDSVSQISRRRDRDQDYSSDDSMVYIRKETRDYDDHSHHRRHMAEGALVGAGAAELFRSHSKKDGGEVSHGASRIGKTVGAGALGAVAVNAASRAREYYRSKSRHRSHSFDDQRSSHSHRHSRHSLHSRGRHSRSRSRSHSHSRAKTLLELGVGAAAVAAGVAALRSKSNANAGDRKGRSRTRSHSRATSRSRGRSVKGEKDTDEAERRKHMAGAGLAGAAVAGLVEKYRSHSRSRKGERSRSRSRLRQALPIVGAGLATAAATGLYEKKKHEKDDKEGASRGRLRSRSHSRAPSQPYPDQARDSAGLIEYGNEPLPGSIPAEHYYGAPGAPPYPEAPEAYGARRTRSRSRSRRGRYSSSSDSDRDRRRKHRSRSRDLAGAALGATGLGYAAHKFNERRKSKSRERERDHAHYDRDPYEESYDPEPYAPAPLDPHFYPNGNQFPPPPVDSTMNGTPAPYNPADYPPPPGAAPPPQPYYGAGPGPEQYHRRADDNVRNPFPDSLNVARSSSQPPVRKTKPEARTKTKSVAFDLEKDGYETDDSSSTVGPGQERNRHHRRRRSSSVPHTRVRHGDGRESEDSGSTLDLPDRFDSQGRLLTEKEERDPAIEQFANLVDRFAKVLF